MVNFFLEHGSDPNAPDKNGVYPLQYAIVNNSKEYVISLLKSNKIDFNQKIRIKKKKCENNLDHQFVDDLIVFDDKKAKLKSLECTESKYKSYLHLAARCENIEIFQLFFDKNLIHR